MASSDVVITTEIDWEALLVSTGTVDTDTESGTLLMATGVTLVQAEGPGYLHPSYAAAGDWRPLEVDLALEAGTSLLIRWTCAATLVGLATSEWTDWVSPITPITVDGSPEITHRLRYDPNAALLNAENDIVDAGPYFNIELRLAR
jgi:hypothetical protein